MLVGIGNAKDSAIGRGKKMGLIKSSGNMYPWVDYCHSHLRGRCPHECDYCYVQHMRCKRFYSGEIKLKKDELEVNYYPKGKTGNLIFIEHMNDLFADGVLSDWIEDVLNHCLLYKDNSYVFQTKNPMRAFDFFIVKGWLHWFRDKSIMVGTTVETDDETLLKEHSKAPSPTNRFTWINALRVYRIPTFITIEPVMDFNPDIMMQWIRTVKPTFINIGADSKKCGLKEPSPDKIMYLLGELKKEGIEVREKHNLDRLMKPLPSRFGTRPDLPEIED